MEEQNNKKSCWPTDKKDMQKMIDYFICRFRRAMFLLIFSYVVINWFFSMILVLMSYRYSPMFAKNAKNEDRKIMEGNKNKEKTVEDDKNKEESTWKNDDIKSVFSELEPSAADMI